LKLTILGSGTCVPTPQRSCSGYLLQVDGQNILFDIGFGALRRMAEASLPYQDIDLVFISHTHPDHVADLVPLLMALKYHTEFKRTNKLTVIGPPGFRNFMDDAAVLFGDWIVSPQQYRLVIKEISRRPVRAGEATVRGYAMAHERNAVGYRLEYKDKVFAYSGDTGPCEAVIKLAQNADATLLECSFPDDQGVAGHLTPTEAGEIAKAARCKKLLLTHFYPMMEHVPVEKIVGSIFSGSVERVHDLKVYEI
jgi:ribonuclease BN (tRNA processing enzyme)